MGLWEALERLRQAEAAYERFRDWPTYNAVCEARLNLAKAFDAHIGVAG